MKEANRGGRSEEKGEKREIRVREFNERIPTDG